MSQLYEDLILILSCSFLSFIIAYSISPFFIKLIKKMKIQQQIKQESMDGSKTPLFHALHKKKTGTPTMGGIVIWLSVFVVCLISILSSYLGFTTFNLINQRETYLPLFTLTSFGILGMIDDYLNVKGIGKTKGLAAKTKLIWMTLLSLLGAYWFHYKLGYDSISIFNQQYFIGIFYFPLFIFLLTATSNAVNITDGLDGLASGLSIITYIALGIIAYTYGLHILATFCATIVGATAAFLWNNIPPAKYFMGDTGSLALGGTMAVIACLTDTILVLPFLTAVFIAETLSVIIQLTSKKLFKRKVFYIAPIHHHYEHIGWPEYKVTMRFWLIGGFFSTLGIILYLGDILH